MSVTETIVKPPDKNHLCLENFQYNLVKAADLFPLAQEVEMCLGQRNEQSQKVTFGLRLANQRDRVYDVQIVFEGKGEEHPFADWPH